MQEEFKFWSSAHLWGTSFLVPEG